ncbi:hypothetical protein [Noviherbaspirillum malthae]|uniref:hypothetical protein n=1 Tax=Noviherbaspirillum malthae TaxID=1260987 RepID=UPI00188F9D57|nr:hypothetical protein [Noviherbaspirillum malthae]
MRATTTGDVPDVSSLWPGVRCSVVALTFLVFQPTLAQATAIDSIQSGLNTLLKRPWDHELRFAMAERLIKAGRINEAMIQLEALEGTSLSYIAAVRLQQIRSDAQPAPASTPVQTDAAYPRVSTATLAQAQVATVPARAIGQNNSAIEIRQLPQFQYLAPGTTPEPTKTLPAGEEAARATVSARTPGERDILSLVAAGHYQEAGTQGVALLARESPIDEVRLAIANSLAWTGRLDAAASVYAAITTGPAALQAELGLANIEHWRGRDESAVRRYRKVLASEPNNEVAREGLKVATRELRPRTTVSAGASTDSFDVRRANGVLTHRWSNPEGTERYEVEASAVRDRSPGAGAQQQDIMLRYAAPTLPLKPNLELSVANRDRRAVHAGMRVSIGEATVELAKVDWGKMAVNPQALSAALDANHAGMEWNHGTSAGLVTARLAYYDISDDNAILTSGLRFVPTWRPLGARVKPFVGIETRDARFNTPQYWSPANGFGTAYAGLLGEWGQADWTLFASAQAGTRLYGEAGRSWSWSTGGKRWLGPDIGIGFALWSMASRRDNADYKARSANVTLEKLW